MPIILLIVDGKLFILPKIWESNVKLLVDVIFTGLVFPVLIRIDSMKSNFDSKDKLSTIKSAKRP